MGAEAFISRKNCNLVEDSVNHGWTGEHFPHFLKYVLFPSFFGGRHFCTNAHGRPIHWRIGAIFVKFTQLILMKIIRIVATRCQILRLKCTKFNFGVLDCLFILATRCIFKSSICTYKLNAPNSFADPGPPLGELTTLPRSDSRMGEGYPSPLPLPAFGVSLSARLRRFGCTSRPPEFYRQIYAYDYT